MRTDSVEKALAAVAACRALREKQLANRLEIQRRLEVVARRVYALKGKRQLELRLQ